MTHAEKGLQGPVKQLDSVHNNKAARLSAYDRINKGQSVSST